MKEKLLLIGFYFLLILVSSFSSSVINDKDDVVVIEMEPKRQDRQLHLLLPPLLEGFLPHQFISEQIPLEKTFSREVEEDVNNELFQIPTHAPGSQTHPPFITHSTSETTETTTTTTTTTTTAPAAKKTPPPAQTGHPPLPKPEMEEEDMECGVANGNNFPVRYNGKGEDVEAAARLITKYITAAGWPAETNEWPWMAAILNGNAFVCGGSLVDSEHILTAAHCVHDFKSPKRLRVKLGGNNLRQQDFKFESAVTRVAYHKGYSPDTGLDDVALLTLADPVPKTLNDTIRPICLPKKSEKDDYKDKLGTVVGWGASKLNSPVSSTLNELTMRLWGVEECKKAWSRLPVFQGTQITERMVCAGELGKDSCQGDSGGPMAVPEAHRWTQVGVVSFGPSCGAYDAPGVYTRITSYIEWIDRVRQIY